MLLCPEVIHGLEKATRHKLLHGIGEFEDWGGLEISCSGGGMPVDGLMLKLWCCHLL